MIQKMEKESLVDLEGSEETKKLSKQYQLMDMVINATEYENLSEKIFETVIDSI